MDYPHIKKALSYIAGIELFFGILFFSFIFGGGASVFFTLVTSSEHFFTLFLIFIFVISFLIYLFCFIEGFNKSKGEKLSTDVTEEPLCEKKLGFDMEPFTLENFERDDFNDLSELIHYLTIDESTRLKIENVLQLSNEIRIHHNWLTEQEYEEFLQLVFSQFIDVLNRYNEFSSVLKLETKDMFLTSISYTEERLSSLINKIEKEQVIQFSQSVNKLQNKQ